MEIIKSLFQNHSFGISVSFCLLSIIMIGQYGYLKTLRTENLGKYSMIFFVFSILITQISCTIFITNIINNIYISFIFIAIILFWVSKKTHDYSVKQAKEFLNKPTKK